MTQRSLPNFSGVWRIDFARSTLFGDVPAQILVAIEHRECGIIQQLSVMDAAGVARRSRFAIEIGGETTNMIGTITTLTHAHWAETELVIESKASVSAREIVFRDYWSLSHDEETLTMAHRDDALAGQVSVFERGSAADVAVFEPC